MNKDVTTLNGQIMMIQLAVTMNQIAVENTGRLTYRADRTLTSGVNAASCPLIPNTYR